MYPPAGRARGTREVQVRFPQHLRGLERLLLRGSELTGSRSGQCRSWYGSYFSSVDNQESVEGSTALSRAGLAILTNSPEIGDAMLSMYGAGILVQECWVTCCRSLNFGERGFGTGAALCPAGGCRRYRRIRETGCPRNLDTRSATTLKSSHGWYC